MLSLLGSTGLLALTACSGSDEPAPAPTGPVEVVVPTPTTGPSVEAACRSLIAALPQAVGEGLARRPVTGDPDRTAAWGDPVVTLACGTGNAGQPGVDGALFALGLPGSDCAVAAPAVPDPRQCLSLLQRDGGASNVFVTFGRAVTVEVSVPDAYDVQVLQDVLPQLVQLPASADP